MTSRVARFLVPALLVLLFTATPAAGQSMGGADLFRLYCAACHGRDGGGHGPVAATMKIEPPDLTVLSIHNSGMFPRARVAALLTGEIAPAAHGSAAMPVWGPIFTGLDDSAARVKVRITNLVAYIESIQKK